MAAIAVASCSATAVDDAAPSSTADVVVQTEDSQPEEADSPSTETTVADEDAQASDAPPASRADENPSTGGADHWIGRGAMTASSIELVWAAVEGAESYRIHRFETVGGIDPDSVTLDETTLVHEGSAAVTTMDDGVVEGTFYTYILEVLVAGGSLERRWTEGLARDDTTPPTPITNLRAESTTDGVLISWDPSSDDVEFASYSVSLVEGDQLRYIGGGADEQQSSFLDTRPPDGVVTYSVQAVDFHDNRTEPATVEYTNG